MRNKIIFSSGFYALNLKSTFKFLFILIVLPQFLYAQVAVGTTTPDDGSALQIESTNGALVPPRMTNAEMNAIPTPLEGSIIYNATFTALYLFSSGTWNNITRPNLPSIVLSYDSEVASTTTNLTVGINDYYQFPLGATSVQNNDSDFFSVMSDGKIKVLKDGNYMITAGLSVLGFPAGNHKYIIGVFKNGTGNANNLIGYLVRGNVKLDTIDEFGTSGVMVFPFSAGNTINLRYVLNKANSSDSTSITARFLKIGIIKI